MKTHGICQIKSHQIQWESYQNLMVTMGFVRSAHIKSYENLFKISWWPWDCQISSHQLLWESNQNLMVTNGICQIKSHQIQWVSFQNLMVTMGFVRSAPIKSNENLIKISWWPWDLSDQFPSNPMRILSKSHEDPWDLSDQIPSNPMRILSKPNGDHGICQISSHQILWESFQNLMVTMGLSDQFPSTPMRI